MKLFCTAALMITLAGIFITDISSPVLAKTTAERNAEAAARRKENGEDDEGSNKSKVNENRHSRDEENFKDYDDDFEKPKKHYDSNEKEIWIYGRPGDADYKKNITDDEYAELEIMWEYDYAVSIIRGLVQGFTRGFYKDYDYDLPAECFGKDSTMQIYYVIEAFSSLEFEQILSAFGLMYNLYFMFDFECETQDHLYDLSQFCFDHDCNPETLLRNEMAKVFQVTGSLNALAAIYYDDQPESEQHTGWFDMYSEVGLNIGKLFRYTLNFDPKEVHDN